MCVCVCVFCEFVSHFCESVCVNWGCRFLCVCVCFVLVYMQVSVYLSLCLSFKAWQQQFLGTLIDSLGEKKHTKSC